MCDIPVLYENLCETREGELKMLKISYDFLNFDY